VNVKNPNRNYLVSVLVGFGKFVDLQNLRSDVTDIANIGHDFLSDLMTPPSSTITTDEIDTYSPHVRGVVKC